METTIKRAILVPLDETFGTAGTLPWASFLARHVDAPVALVHVAAPASTPPDSPRRVERQLQCAAQRIRSDGVACSAQIVAGDPIRELVRSARAIDARLIVMGSRGRPSPNRSRIGSVAQGLIERASAPVLLLPPEAAVSPEGGSVAGPVLVPLDGSELAELALSEAVELARALDRGVLLARAKDPFDPIDGESLANPYVVNAIDEAIDGYLWSVSEWVKRQGVSVATASGWARPEAFIEELVARHHPVVVCLSTRGTGGLGRIRLGRVADAVARGARAPTLLVGAFAAQGRRSPLRGKAPDGDRRVPRDESDIPTAPPGPGSGGADESGVRGDCYARSHDPR